MTTYMIYTKGVYVDSRIFVQKMDGPLFDTASRDAVNRFLWNKSTPHEIVFGSSYPNAAECPSSLD
jgi:hypothetical protein